MTDRMAHELLAALNALRDDVAGDPAVLRSREKASLHPVETAPSSERLAISNVMAKLQAESD